ncbi:MAG: membrane protein insertion efficiency factor YidD [Leptospiraceae bacterium]|nr:membrane protein insertion efficiency factor YidD [Leptospiraceae bacterium]MCK6380736.1 membrane protein insertion efficiency factor YidD [Leptospiraceae bacterium]NUM40283.1 membrane protein insertion efficiency factor YidD [Leptospiraceae bacterium]
MNKLAILLIKIYKTFISPILPGVCRFYPSCSEYSLQAYQNYNFFMATYFTIKRILRCNPLSKGYFDPLPYVSQNCKHKEHK